MRIPRMVGYPAGLLWLVGVAVGAWPIIDWLEALDISFLVILPIVALAATAGLGFAVALTERDWSLESQAAVLAGLVAVGVFVAMAVSGGLFGWFDDGGFDVPTYLVLSLALCALAFPLAVIGLLFARTVLPRPSDGQAAALDESPEQ